MAEPLGESFLGSKATTAQRWQAIHQNAEAYYQRCGQAGTTSHIGTLGTLVWTSGHLCVPSEASLEAGHAIDEILSWYRSQRPLQGAIWWYIGNPRLSKLNARLLARGLGLNWSGNWMQCDLRERRESIATASDFTIRLPTTEDYLASAENGDFEAQNLSKENPRRVFHFVAFRGIKRLGKCVVNITTGDLGVAVLFDM